MRYLILALLVGCGGEAKEDWELEEDFCYQQGGIAFVDGVDVNCQLPDIFENKVLICFGICKPFSEECPRIECD